MDTIALLFTRRRWNPVSWLIRWVMPRSRFALALSSHCIVIAGGRAFEAHMLAGVREVDPAVALAGHIVACRRDFFVPSSADGIAWARTQLCTYAGAGLLFNNNYDWTGALCIGLAPDRDWADPSKWFCYEFGAGFLRACGRNVFANLSHIGETALLAIEQ